MISLKPVHPGVTLAAELKARGISASAAAMKMQLNNNRLTDVTRGARSITPETALRLGRFFGNDPQFWMNLQSNYDLQMAREKHGAQIEFEVEPLS
jgi:antitoxin HigA-1